MKTNKMTEIFKDIEGYEGLYQVSNLGNVKSLKYNGTCTEHMLKPCNVQGYLMVNLYKNGKTKGLYIHRLVAQAFIDNPDNLDTIDHINNIKDDNSVDNLQWLTLEDNVRKSNTKDINESKVFKLRKQGLSQQKIGDIIGCSHVTISRILNNKRFKEVI